MTHAFTLVSVSHEDVEIEVEADSIFDVSQAYITKKYGGTVTRDMRVGSVHITADKRKWFLHMVKFDFENQSDQETLLITADHNN